MARTFRLLRRRAVADHGTTIEDLAARAADSDRLQAALDDANAIIRHQDGEIRRYREALTEAADSGKPDALRVARDEAEALAVELFEILAVHGIDGVPFDPNGPEFIVSYLRSDHPGVPAARRIDDLRAERTDGEHRIVRLELPEAPLPGENEDRSVDNTSRTS
ncbi:MAG: hypothetical protein AAFZ07_19635 [Actinomycetota bacterium]